MEFQAYTIKHHPEWACIQARAPDSQERTPVHLCCVIDTSASMKQENKLHNVKQSLQFLLDYLGPNDTLSVVTFSDNARTILHQIYADPNEKENTRTRLSLIQVESNTNLSAGIIMARKTLFSGEKASHVKQGILLLTDGIANCGITSSDRLTELIEHTLTQFPGTSVSCVGYGTDHNVLLLQKISAVGGGPYYVVNNLEDVASVFGDVLGGLVTCSLQQIRISLPPKTIVKTRYATHKTPTHLEIIIGDLPAGMNAAFLAKLDTNTPLSLQGFSLSNHYEFELSTKVITTDDETLQTNGEAHYLRFEVLNLIEETRRYVNPYVSDEDEMLQHYLQNIKTYLQAIQEYKQIHPHDLWDILLDELHMCKRHLINRNNAAPDTPHIMLQHGSYLGRMRGIAAVVSDQELQPPYPAVHSAFSNSIQRQISSQLGTQVSQEPDNGPGF